MWSPRRGSQPQGRPNRSRRLAVLAALAVGWMVPSTGCQVEYAGMTLPSGKYMHDDVQYFAPGTDFPWANTQAATQRARMQGLGMEVPAPGQGGPLTVTPGQGALPRVQNLEGRPTDTNVAPEPPMPNNGLVPNVAPAPGAEVVPPPGVAPMAPASGEAVTPPGPPTNP